MDETVRLYRCIQRPAAWKYVFQNRMILMRVRKFVILFSPDVRKSSTLRQSGSCYAINGNIKQISETIVIVTPEDIDITGDLQELASSNVNVPAFGYSEEE